METPSKPGRSSLVAAPPGWPLGLGLTAAQLLTDGTRWLLAQPACCHGNGRILLSYSLLTRTKPATGSSFALRRDVRCIPSAPGSPLSPAGNPFWSVWGRSSRSWSSLRLSHGWKTPCLYGRLLLFFLQMLMHLSLLLLISSKFSNCKVQPVLFFITSCL